MKSSPALLLSLGFSSLCVLGCSVIAGDDQAGKGGVPLRLTEPRIKPIEERDWTPAERELLAPLKTEGGLVLNLYKTMARHPKLFTPRLNFGRYIQRQSTLPARDREILICRIALLCRCGYEWSHHTKIALESGITKEDLERIGKGAQAKGLAPFDAVLVKAVDELWGDFIIHDETWNTLAKQYSNHQMMDLVFTVGGYQMLATALNSFGVQLDQGLAGVPVRFDKDWVDPGQLVKGGLPMRLSKPRIAPVSEATWTAEEQELLLPLKKQYDRLPNVHATMARHPALFRPWLAFARYILRQSTLPAREREMLICRIAWRTSGEYEWSHHVRLGKEAGLTDEEILRLATLKGVEGWSSADAAIVGAVDQLHMGAFINDATWKELAKRFDTHQMMDLVFTVGAYKMLALGLNSFGTQLDAGTTGFPK